MTRTGPADRKARILGACALLLWPPISAGATPDPSSLEPYDVQVSVVLADASRGAEFAHRALTTSIPNPSTTVPLAVPVLRAFEGVARGIFRAPPEAPAVLVLEIGIVGADIAKDGLTGNVVVKCSVLVREASGREIDRWQLRGDSRIVGLGEEGVHLAFGRAIRTAAANLDRSISESLAVAAWLLSRGITVRAAPPPPLPPPPRPRPPLLAYLDVGGGFLLVQDDLRHPLTLRAGISGRRAMVQLVADRWRRSGGHYRGYDFADWRINAVGLDAGGVLRFTGGFELRAGAGARFERGRTTVTLWPGTTEIERSTGSANLFLALQSAEARLAVPLRIAVELRKHFGSRFAADSMGPEIETASFSLAVTIGAEFPVGRP